MNMSLEIKSLLWLLLLIGLVPQIYIWEQDYHNTLYDKLFIGFLNSITMGTCILSIEIWKYVRYHGGHFNAMRRHQ